MAAAAPNHYDILGIARDADASEVRGAWKLHVQVWHPDRFSGEMREEAEKRAARINEAYTTLRDGSRRAAYDCRLAADDRDAERVRSTPRAATMRRSDPTRPASTPIGTPMAVAEPANLGEQLNAVAVEAMRSARRHPRIVAAAVASWMLVLGGGAVLQTISGPTLPTGATVAAASPSHASRILPSEDIVDLEELAEQAQHEAAQADAEMAQMVAQDAAAARAADAQDAAAARAAAVAAAKAPKAAAGASAATPAPDRRRIVRVMPTTPAQ